ncbi:Immunoglobulin-like and fibronectin type III domain-containing protein 1, partial [Dryobates pubescens]
SALRCYINKQLLNVSVLKGESAELSCTVSKEDVTGTWYKDGLKLTSMDGVTFEKKGLVHKLVINKAADIHAGKYRFQGGDVKTEAYVFVEDPPQVDKVLLKTLSSVPTVAKAGQGVKLKLPFEGRLPIRASWLKDRMELADDTRMRLDTTDTCTVLSIPSCQRKDSGDYKVRLKNDSGVLEIDLKLLVVAKPQPPEGPLKVVESSADSISIQWKAPRDDGGKPLLRYLVERQQGGRNEWEALGESPRTSTTFTTTRVEEDMSYYFRVRAVNAEGASEALESGEVKAAGKASPGAPEPPEIVGATKDSVTIAWRAPRQAGSSGILGYMVQKRKKGTITWLPVNTGPLPDKKMTVPKLKQGLQYEFRVAAVNAAGLGDASAPSQPACPRDASKPPGPVQELRVSSSDSSSVTLTWKRPEGMDGKDVKGYEVEMRSSKSHSWTKCNALPLELTTYTLKGLQATKTYCLRVRALGEGGPGEAVELEACVGDAPPEVPPRLLIDGTLKSTLVVRAGNTIKVKIPFEGSPEPVVTWLKDGLPLPKRAASSTKDGTTQLLVAAAEFSDSGTYTVELQDGLGKREAFSFQVQVTDVPQPPGPLQLAENVPGTVTVTWEPSASEKWERNLFYTVLKREAEKGLWQVVGDLIYTNKFTFTKLLPGRDYYFRVVAKNELGVSGPSETLQPWRIRRPKAPFEVRAHRYRGVNQSQPPRILVPLKPHIVPTGSECHMSCAVGGHPPPKVTWYKDSRDLSSDPAYFCTNDFGVCSLVVLGVCKQDEGEYMVEATNASGRAFSRAFLTIKG